VPQSRNRIAGIRAGPDEHITHFVLERGHLWGRKVVAATDFEFWHEAGRVDADRDLSMHYEFPTTLRDAIEEHLAIEAQASPSGI